MTQCNHPKSAYLSSTFSQLLLAVLSGILLFLASPGTFSFAPCAWVALVPLFLAIQQASSPRKAAFIGLVCGAVYYISLLYWIVIVLGTYGYLHWSISTLALLLLSLYMSCYLALFAYGLKWTLPVFPPVFSAPLLWVALDLVRGRLFTGFPWMDLAYTQYRFSHVIQIADIFGHYGVTFLIVMVNGLVSYLLFQFLKKKALNSKPATQNSHMVFFAYLLSAALLIIGSFTYGMFRIEHVSRLTTEAATASLAVVQGNIDQDRKWKPGMQMKTIDSYIHLSERALKKGEIDLIIWPETALPFFPLESPFASELTQRLILPNRIELLTGAPHRHQVGENSSPRYYNRALLFSAAGAITGAYDKLHLVPFGEYIPFRRFLPFAAPVVETMADFSPGASAAPISCQTAQIGVLICFESIFPELARHQVEQGADLLVNITNDAWFGRSSAPWQHLSMAVFRAVETRRSLARAANTGISAFIDPLGRLTRTSPLFVPCFLTEDLPILTGTTFYVTAGHHFASLCLLLLIPGAMIVNVQKHRIRTFTKTEQLRKKDSPH